MKVLYLPFGQYLDPWYPDLLDAIGGRHVVEMYDARQPTADQFFGVDVVIDQGGSAGTRQLMEAASAAGVKLWQIIGTGVDHVDVAYLTERGIPLANTPGQFSSIALAEHALFFMLYFAKNAVLAQQNLRNSVFYEPLNGELNNKTLCLVGLGASGRELARRARALGMRVIGIDVVDVPPEVRDEAGLTFVGGPAHLEQLLAEADYVSIHVPLTTETRALINRRAFAAMKPGSVFINVARGAIVDEEALLDALRSGRLKGAGLDVFAHEPIDPSHPLLQLDNVIATPHIAGSTAETSRRRTGAAAENIDRLSRGLTPLYQVV